jgi:hypothetical protein
MPQKKSPLTRPGIDPGIFRLVAQRLNHYATPGLQRRGLSESRTNTRAKATEELSIHLEDSVSTKTARREVNKCSNHGKAATVKPLISENNAKRRKRWYDDHKTWKCDDWKYVTWSDESSFTLYPTSDRANIWITP